MKQIAASATQFALENYERLPDSAHVPIAVLCALQACSAATIWRRVRDGEIIPPVKLGKRTTRWKVGDLRKSMAGEK